MKTKCFVVAAAAVNVDSATVIASHCLRFSSDADIVRLTNARIIIIIIIIALGLGLQLGGLE